MKKALLLSLIYFCAPAQANDCLINVTNPQFGVYNTFAPGNHDTTGSISMTGAGCNGVPYTLQLSKGNSHTYLPRRLMSYDDQLEYNLYLDTGRTQIFGDGTEGTAPLSTSSGSVSIFGRIPGLQRVTPGQYSDSLSVYIVY